MTELLRLNCGALQHRNSMRSSPHMFAWASCVVFEYSRQTGMVVGESVGLHAKARSPHIDAGRQRATQPLSSLRDSITPTATHVH
jgi:hypothetical protein